MFEIGDQVFCPLRGCGKIEAIEKRTMLGEEKEYYIIQMVMAKMTVMVPIDKIETSGFRHISNEETAKKVLDFIADKSQDLTKSTPLKERLKENNAKLASGRLEDYGQVIKELTARQKEKSLNSSENTMLLEARKLLIDEISMIKVVPRHEVTAMLDSLLA